MTCPSKHEYKYCSHCHSIYNDKDGLLDTEDGKLFIIPGQCKVQYDIYWSIEKGYPCCKVALENKSGKWSVMQ